MFLRPPSPFLKLKKAILQQDMTSLRNFISSNLNLLNSTCEEAKTLLHFAARFGSVECVALLVDENKLNITDQEGNTPLHIALSHQKYPTASFLLRAGANADIANRAGFRPSEHPQVKNLINEESLRLSLVQVKNDILKHSDVADSCKVQANRLTPLYKP